MGYQVNASMIQSLNSRLTNAQAIADSINQTASRFSIDQSPRRMRYFVAQSFFETLNYTYWSENLNYTTPERLVTVWPSRFTMEMPAALGGPLGQVQTYAADYVNNPQKLANFVYANRNGNGNVASGDGYNFRGRGAFHLTFLSNYTEYSHAAYGDDRVVQNPDMVAQPADAFLSAGWFWDANKMNALADADAFTQATKVINGSTATVPQRLPVLNKMNATLQW